MCVALFFACPLASHHLTSFYEMLSSPSWVQVCPAATEERHWRTVLQPMFGLDPASRREQGSALAENHPPRGVRASWSSWRYGGGVTPKVTATQRGLGSKNHLNPSKCSGGSDLEGEVLQI